jgi:hypothetical protein
MPIPLLAVQLSTEYTPSSSNFVYTEELGHHDNCQ